MTVHQTVRRLAEALDRDDFDALATLLEPNAVYDAAGDGVLHGVAAIVDVFRRNAVWGHAHIDVVEFRHRLDEREPTAIHFTDVLKHRGEELARTR